MINGYNNFQNFLNDTLTYQNIQKHPERISNLKPYNNKYNWEGIEFPAGPKDWKKFEKKQNKIALNILFIPHNTETIRVAYRSEYNNKPKTQVILWMITDGKKMALSCCN